MINFNLLDVVLILLVFSFTVSGFFFGLIRKIGSLIGLVLAIFIAGRYFMPIALWLTPILGGNIALARVISFVVIFLIINKVINFIFKWINGMFNFISFIPFFKTINRFSGLILGLLEGILLVGVFIYVLAKLMPDSSFVINNLNSSKVAHYLVMLSGSLINLLPSAFDRIKSIF